MSKSKFQISRLLEKRINDLTDASLESADLGSTTVAFILGFHSGNSSNYIGLTTDSASIHNTMPVIGLVFFRSEPDEVELSSLVEKLQKLDDNFTCDETDKNRNMYLVYHRSNETNKMVPKIFDFSSKSYVLDQPKLVVLDETKIYNHSPVVKLSSKILLDINDLDSQIEAFSSGGEGFTFNLKSSNFSAKTPVRDAGLTETLYDYLDAPAEVLQAGDYLPQMSRSEKEKLVEKWRNKMKNQRAPLEIEIEHENLSFTDDSIKPSNDKYPLDLEIYSRIQVNDSVSKTCLSILALMGRMLMSIKKIISREPRREFEKSELKSCSFNPATLGHFVQVIYPISSTRNPDFQHLKNMRLELHQTFLLPLSSPLFRYSQRITNVMLQSPDEFSNGYLCNVHLSILDQSKIKNGIRSIINGRYTYHHYLQDKVQDNGWGCAYRSLQTIISWFKHQGYIYSPDVEPRGPKACDQTHELRTKLNSESRVPTHNEIQTVLVHIGDKQENFIGSQKWIGSQEVCYVLNHLYNLDSKFISVSSGGDLTYKARELAHHFDQQSTPVMIGGGVLAHTIIGIDFNEKTGDTSYLILDPHYTGSEDISTITKKGWCGWKRNNFWEKSSFYNLCLPQRPVEY